MELEKNLSILVFIVVRLSGNLLGAFITFKYLAQWLNECLFYLLIATLIDLCQRLWRNVLYCCLLVKNVLKEYLLQCKEVFLYEDLGTAVALKNLAQIYQAGPSAYQRHLKAIWAACQRTWIYLITFIGPGRKRFPSESTLSFFDKRHQVECIDFQLSNRFHRPGRAFAYGGLDLRIVSVNV